MGRNGASSESRSDDMRDRGLNERSCLEFDDVEDSETTSGFTTSILAATGLSVSNGPIDR